MLRTARLRLRPISPDDAAAVEAVYGDAATMTTMPWRRLADRGAVDAWLRDRLSEQARTRHGTYVISDHEGTLVGFCGFLPRDEELEIGWVIQKPHWGNGFATEAVAAVLATTEDRRIVAAIRPGNLASMRVAEKVGLRFDHEAGDEFGALLVYANDSCSQE
jgi:RimJ/RimL family protein N-acetyltransferase